MAARKLWVLSAHRKKAYAATFDKLDVLTNKYFYGCDCSSIMVINEDQFLCREDIECTKCKSVVRATFEWNREMLTIPKEPIKAEDTAG